MWGNDSTFIKIIQKISISWLFAEKTVEKYITPDSIFDSSTKIKFQSLKKIDPKIIFSDKRVPQEHYQWKNYREGTIIYWWNRLLICIEHEFNAKNIRKINPHQEN